MTPKRITALLALMTAVLIGWSGYGLRSRILDRFADAVLRPFVEEAGLLATIFEIQYSGVYKVDRRSGAVHAVINDGGTRDKRFTVQLGPGYPASLLWLVTDQQFAAFDKEFRIRIEEDGEVVCEFVERRTRRLSSD